MSEPFDLAMRSSLERWKKLKAGAAMVLGGGLKHA